MSIKMKDENDEDDMEEEIDPNIFGQKSKAFRDFNLELKEVVDEYEKEFTKLKKNSDRELSKLFSDMKGALRRKNIITLNKMKLSKKQKKQMKRVRAIFSPSKVLGDDMKVDSSTMWDNVPRSEIFLNLVEGELWEEEDDEVLEEAVETYGVIGIADVVAQNYPYNSFHFVKNKMYELMGAKSDGSNAEQKYKAYCRRKKIKQVKKLLDYDISRHRVFSDDEEKSEMYFNRFLLGSVFRVSEYVEGYIKDPTYFLYDYFQESKMNSKLFRGWEDMPFNDSVRLCDDFEACEEYFDLEKRWKRMKKFCAKKREVKVPKMKKGNFKEGFLGHLSESNGIANVVFVGEEKMIDEV